MLYTITVEAEDENVSTYSNIVLNDEEFDNFIAACERADPPNEELLSAFAFAKARGVS